MVQDMRADAAANTAPCAVQPAHEHKINKDEMNRLYEIMKKSLILLLLMCLFLIGCKENTKKEAIKLSELQVTACNTANEAGTCDTRLSEVGIVLKEDCCKSLGKGC